MSNSNVNSIPTHSKTKFETPSKMTPASLETTSDPSKLNEPSLTPSTDVYHTEQRLTQLTQFVQSSFPAYNLRIESLLGDASFRRYHRVYLEGLKSLNDHTDISLKSDQDHSEVANHKNLDPSYIVMDAPPQLESIESFVRIDDLMAPHINVPTLLAKDVENGFLILQDFGGTEFAHLVHDAKIKQNAGLINDLYRWAIDGLIQLQSIDVKMAQEVYQVPEYDAAILEREMALFSEWFLPYIGIDFEEQDHANSNKLWVEFNRHIISELLNHPTVVVHRDYHSRNLMQDQYNKAELGVIDFQDALIGSYTYDLVSLLRDAYVEWSEDQVQDWIEYYWQQSKKLDLIGASNLKQFTTELNLMGVQRHLKVLGIFIRLAQRDGKTRYLADIPKVWGDLMIEMRWLATHGDPSIQSIIQPVLDWLEQTVQPKYTQVFSV